MDGMEKKLEYSKENYYYIGKETDQIVNKGPIDFIVSRKGYLIQDASANTLILPIYGIYSPYSFTDDLNEKYKTPIRLCIKLYDLQLEVFQNLEYFMKDDRIKNNTLVKTFSEEWIYSKKIGDEGRSCQAFQGVQFSVLEIKDSVKANTVIECDIDEIRAVTEGVQFEKDAFRDCDVFSIVCLKKYEDYF